MKVGFLFYPKALMTGVSLSAEMLRCASLLRSRHQQRHNPLTIELFTVSEADSVTTLSGLTLRSNGHFSQAQPLDLIIIPPMWGNPIPVVNKHPELIPWLQHQYASGAKLVATGTGVCWLAEAGLLDDGVATTHWYFLDKFRQRYPQVNLNRQATVTESNNIYCTASINSQTEMVVYLIRTLFGDAIAGVIEQHFSHEVSASSQQPFYQQGGSLQFEESIALILDFIEQNLSAPITNQDMADSCHLSLRTFNRKFKQQVGQSPHVYLQHRRLEEGKRLLRDIGLRVGEVAALVGYQDAAHFSNRFSRYFGVTPKAYRAMGKAKVYQ